MKVLPRSEGEGGEMTRNWVEWFRITSTMRYSRMKRTSDEWWPWARRNESRKSSIEWSSSRQRRPGEGSGVNEIRWYTLQRTDREETGGQECSLLVFGETDAEQQKERRQRQRRRRRWRQCCVLASQSKGLLGFGRRSRFPQTEWSRQEEETEGCNGHSQAAETREGEEKWYAILEQWCTKFWFEIFRIQSSIIFKNPRGQSRGSCTPLSWGMQRSNYTIAAKKAKASGALSLDAVFGKDEEDESDSDSSSSSSSSASSRSVILCVFVKNCEWQSGNCRSSSSKKSSASSKGSGDEESKPPAKEVRHFIHYFVSKKKKKKKEFQVELLQELIPARLSRFKCSKIVHAPFFKQIVVGCYIRIGVGPMGGGQSRYQVCLRPVCMFPPKHTEISNCLCSDHGNSECGRNCQNLCSRGYQNE